MWLYKSYPENKHTLFNNKMGRAVVHCIVPCSISKGWLQHISIIWIMHSTSHATVLPKWMFYNHILQTNPLTNSFVGFFSIKALWILLCYSVFHNLNYFQALTITEPVSNGGLFSLTTHYKRMWMRNIAGLFCDSNTWKYSNTHRPSTTC